MRWNITDMLVSPTTGTAFAVASNSAGKSVIVWYKGDYFLRPNNSLQTDAKGIIVNGKMHQFSVIHTMPYFHHTWEKLKNSCHCPGNDNISLRTCDQQHGCLFELCPYGIKMVS
ncbi:anti-adapter protein iraM [Kosakonia sp. BYX6]|uniref:Anti-adapter protein iraM n=1 Tax=Kosakonia calanthes TaxID=3139408 RepID=A0ABZ3BFT7_9ENTR